MHFMWLHIFMGDEELLYFIVRVEVIEIQIWFEFKLVCNLHKGLKIYKGLSIFPWRIGLNSRSRPGQLTGAHPSRAARSSLLSMNST
jgi:hypothetical protein